MKKQRSKTIWLATTAMAVASASGGFAFAQSNPPLDQATSSSPKAADAVDEIVITGLRASAQRAVKIKRASDQIIDTVSATDIGQLPDFNAGDALKRVPGVDALLYQGEPRFIIVRGFNENYNDTLIDGFTLSSTDINLGQTNSGGRQVSMEVLPSNIASHIDVVKSAIPSTDGNFIGGLTNFVTPSAFDFKNNSLSVSLVGGESLSSKGDGGDKGTGQAEISGSKRFGDHEQFGVYLSATYWLRDINVPQAETGGTRNWYTSAGKLTTAYGGNGYAVPSQRLYYNYQNSRDRSGLQGRFDWQPTARFSAYVNAYHFHQDERSDRNDLNAAVQSSSQDLNETATSGTLTNVTQTVQLGRLRWNRNLSGLYARFNDELVGGWKLDGGSSWSNGTVNNPQTWDNFSQTKLQYNYDTSGSTPVFSAVNPASASNLSLYHLGYHREELYQLNENRFDEQLNLTRNSAPDARGLGLALGVRGTGIFQQVSFSRVSWSGASYTLSDVTSGNTLCGFSCDTAIPVINAGLADSFFHKYQASETATRDLAADAGGSYHSREVVVAGYGQVQYRADHWYVVGGLRIEATYGGSSSTQATNGVYTPVSASHDYVNPLPSILAVIDTGDTSKLRLGVSETLSRPTFGAGSLHGGVLNTTTTPATLSVGNPNLKPRHAENYDIGHDWYIDHGHGIISIAAFYKTIHDDIFTYGQTESVAGVSGPVLVTEARNSGSVVKDYGAELSLSEDLRFLPAPFDGLGVGANATLSKARFPVTLTDGSIRTFSNLPDQPGQIYNASIYYDKGRIHGRLAWNHLGQLWDDRYPNFTPQGFYANRFQQPTDNFDLQVSYDVTPHTTVSFDGLNLSGQGMQYRYGLHQELLQSEWKLPTEVMFGIKFRT